MWRDLLIGRERALLALERLELLLPGLTRAGVAAVVDARWSFARHMLAQLDRQDDHVLFWLRDDARPEIAEILNRFVNDRETMARGFQEHAYRYWLDESIALDPEGYGCSLAPMLQKARDLLHAEKEKLHLLVEALPSRQRAAPISPSRRWADQAGKYRSTAPASAALRTAAR